MQGSGKSWAYAAAVLTAVIVGFSFLFTKQALESATPVDTLMYRFAASFAAVSIPAAFGWIRLEYKGKPWKRVVVLSLLYPMAFFAFQAFGLQRTTSAEGGIIFAFTPVITMLAAAMFLKETTNWKQKAGIFLSVFGVVFIFVMKGSQISLSSIAGAILLLLSCVSFAGYSVMARSLSKQFRPVELSYLMMGLAFAAMLVISLAEHAAKGTLNRMLVPLSEPSFLVAVLYLGILSSLVTSWLSNYALSKLEASRTSVFSNLGTVVSIAAGAMFLGERIYGYHIIGTVMIIAGVIGVNLLGDKKTGTRPQNSTALRGK